MDITRIWLTDDAIHIRTADGREASELFADYARLRNAPRAALEDYTTTPDGIHWNTLNEDLCFEAFFRPRRANNPLYRLFLAHPELNVAAVARRIGISQSLMAQYISGAKRPSRERTDIILETLHSIGRELSAATF